MNQSNQEDQPFGNYDPADAGMNPNNNEDDPPIDASMPQLNQDADANMTQIMPSQDMSMGNTQPGGLGLDFNIGSLNVDMGQPTLQQDSSMQQVPIPSNDQNISSQFQDAPEQPLQNYPSAQSSGFNQNEGLVGMQEDMNAAAPPPVTSANSEGQQATNVEQAGSPSNSSKAQPPANTFNSPQAIPQMPSIHQVEKAIPSPSPQEVPQQASPSPQTSNTQINLPNISQPMMNSPTPQPQHQQHQHMSPAPGLPQMPPINQMNGQNFNNQNFMNQPQHTGIPNLSDPRSHDGQFQQVKKEQVIQQYMDTIKAGRYDEVVNFNLHGVEPKNIRFETYNQTPVFFACLVKNEDLVIKFIDYFKSIDVSVDYKDDLNQSAIYYASREGLPRVIEHLHSLGCDVNNKDKYGQTPIYYAVRDNQFEAVKKLIQLKTDLNLTDINEQTPLYYAVKLGHLEVTEILLNSGANAIHSDKRKFSPMQVAEKSKKTKNKNQEAFEQIIKLLIEHGAEPIVKKAPPPKRPTTVKKRPGVDKKEPKKYVLAALKNGVWCPLEESDLQKIKEECPEVYNVIMNNEAASQLPIPEVPETVTIFDHWDKAAKKIILALGKIEGAWIFQDPVDYEAWKIFDYPEIIKNPMCFTEIKEKLNKYEYKSMKAFVDDVNLVFSNCILYNGEYSEFGQLAKKVRTDFEKLYEVHHMDFYNTQTGDDQNSQIKQNN